jgi:hypothetical protein
MPGQRPQLKGQFVLVRQSLQLSDLSFDILGIVSIHGKPSCLGKLQFVPVIGDHGYR